MRCWGRFCTPPIHRVQTVHFYWAEPHAPEQLFVMLFVALAVLLLWWGYGRATDE